MAEDVRDEDPLHRVGSEACQSHDHMLGPVDPACREGLNGWYTLEVVAEAGKVIKQGKRRCPRDISDPAMNEVEDDFDGGRIEIVNGQVNLSIPH